MASVDLAGTAWLHAAADLADAMQFELNGLSRAAAITSASSAYAGGVFRQVSTPGKQRSAQITLGFLTDDAAAWVEAHQGQRVCFRGPRGEKWYGFYTEVPVDPRMLPDSNSTQITITETSWSEAVSA